MIPVERILADTLSSYTSSGSISATNPKDIS